jgi:hypothetical protein
MGESGNRMIGGFGGLGGEGGGFGGDRKGKVYETGRFCGGGSSVGRG